MERSPVAGNLRTGNSIWHAFGCFCQHADSGADTAHSPLVSSVGMMAWQTHMHPVKTDPSCAVSGRRFLVLEPERPALAA